jgi:hypothetical protein
MFQFCRPVITGRAFSSRHVRDVNPAVVGKASYGPFVDDKTEELRAAHDVLAEFYAERRADALDHIPVERAVLGLFCDLTLAADLGTSVGDVGCSARSWRHTTCSKSSGSPHPSALTPR